jgi:hypothetical protein
MLSDDGTNFVGPEAERVPGFPATVAERCPRCSIFPFNNPFSLKVRFCPDEGALARRSHTLSRTCRKPDIH